ncbi:hypothetical protein [Mucilaginibacter lappiensis]|uniref:DUF937 domain-containing protein n=1 Tax=Mucilaginibacter lappiensis TaxID=354630 RepID=A0A841JIG6_9SPHI|nr:hypothetical protein [Mucilaginibacter lappiensis]MBB6129396.1 hypothetical protein [Mucilaginibacter lappiensis]
MFDELLKLVQNNAGAAITDNPQIPNEHNEAAVQDASSSIMDVLGNHASSGGGGLSGVLDLLKGGGGDLTSNPIVGQIIQQFSGKLQNNYGVDGEAAQSTASSLIPQVLGQLANKTNDAGDSSFNIQSILGSLGGADGKFDISDALNLFHGGGADNAEGSSGGILGKLTGLFGGSK